MKKTYICPIMARMYTIFLFLNINILLSIGFPLIIFSMCQCFYLLYSYEVAGCLMVLLRALSSDRMNSQEEML